MTGSGGEHAGGPGPMKDYSRRDDYGASAPRTGPPQSPRSTKPLWIGFGIFITIAALVGAIALFAR